MIIISTQEEVNDDNIWFDIQSYIWMRCQTCFQRRLVRPALVRTISVTGCDKCGGGTYKLWQLWRERVVFVKNVVICA